MARKLLIAALAALLLGYVPLQADDLGLALFEQYLDALRRQAGVPGLAVVIVGDNDIVWERGLGQQDIERAIPMRADTPIHVDGLTQMLTAEMVLRCAEERRLSLNDTAARYEGDFVEPGATLYQLLTHTSGAPDALVFHYDPARLEPTMRAVKACGSGSFRKTMGNLFERLAMVNSAPGPDVLTLVPPAEGIPEPAAAARYKAILEKLATPYAVDKRGRATPSQYVATQLTAGSGAISSARDLAQFDLALRRGVLLQGTSLAAAWQNPLNRAGQPLPHGMGWFVQVYKGEPVIWQFGVGENASSSLLVHIPGRRVTLILLANSDGLVRPFPLGEGDLNVSPFGRLLLRLFVG